MSDQIEKILHAAVISKDSKMTFLGKCHADCFHQAKNVGIAMTSLAGDQGFFTNKGRFVRREEAAHIAYRAGQISRAVEYLFSEDMWSLQSGGKYSYTSVKGYHL